MDWTMILGQVGPSEVTVPETVACVVKAIGEDRHITYGKLKLFLNIPEPMLYKILTENLYVKSFVRFEYLPHKLNEQKAILCRMVQINVKKIVNGKYKDVVSIMPDNETKLNYYDVPTTIQRYGYLMMRNSQLKSESRNLLTKKDGRFLQ